MTGFAVMRVYTIAHDIGTHSETAVLLSVEVVPSSVVVSSQQNAGRSETREWRKGQVLLHLEDTQLQGRSTEVQRNEDTLA